MATLGYRAEIDAGRRFLESIKPEDEVVLLFHGDADGCCAGAIMYRTLAHLGDQLIHPAFMEKGETIYSESLAKRVLARNPTHLIVLDAGSRDRPILPGITTMVIDHHKPQGMPPVDAFITSYGVDPPAPASLMAYHISHDMIELNGRDWIAAIGTGGDLGLDADVEVLKNARKRFGVKALREAISLVNAARRSSYHDIASAFGALIKAESPVDIAEGAMPESAQLARYRQEVNSELRSAMRTAPKFSGRWALLRFASPALVHPLVAIAWTGRLRDNLVLAANEGYTEGNVHFSLRSAMDVDLMEELQKVRPVESETEYAHGHPKATGGILPAAEFGDFLRQLGFSEDVVEQAA